MVNRIIGLMRCTRTDWSKEHVDYMANMIRAYAATSTFETYYCDFQKFIKWVT